MKSALRNTLGALLMLSACATTSMEDSPAALDLGQPTADLPAPSVPAAAEDLLPPQAQPPSPPRRARAVAPISALTSANAEARRRPDPDAFVDATQMYDYTPGALYEVYAAPGYLSTILLESGEAIVTVAAGDTTRWMVEETTSGDLADPRTLLLIKPTRAGIRTNIVLATDRRTYLIEAIAVQGSAYSAQTAWRYPNREAEHNSGGISGVALDDLNFRYRIDVTRGRFPSWRPVRVFDDGRRTYIEFPLDISTSEAPPLFLRDGAQVALVNYRVSGNRYVIDRLFDVAELRLGAQQQTIVRISRERPRSVGGRR
ncbi:MAG: P-type conjugative transfer protein TrbG [Hyphomonadaceae bacterium]|nr:P-type conjugative transfer protein TrbG [Hyphomonadaceae bacterium]